ncbi:MAG: hypothetical protein FE78DRAFT_152389 [Acidomyces sp. 'richmondensis']|nr:MAG: hypothetical protein FE78DRAFT_152389 [Acidomyces sp. 'richmondensis']
MPPISPKRVASADVDISPPPPKRRITATTSSKAVSNFFTPASRKAPETITFQTLNESLFIARYRNATSVKRAKPIKIAAFDFDDTLISTKSGNKFARGADDWKWWHPTVPGRLKQLDSDGYAVIIMSNQAAVSLRCDSKSPKDGMKSLNNLKGKVTAILNSLDIPIIMYAATANDIYRKPRTGMWDQMLKDYTLGEADAVDYVQSMFVGDAAGREGGTAAGIKKDHSCSDRDFAANIGIQFHTPEEFFFGEAVSPFVRTFDPAAFIDVATPSVNSGPPLLFTPKHNPELVLFCGSPGAGKSTWYWTYLEPLGYVRVNQDILKSREKCMKMASQYLEEGKSVVVDNTNADIETRVAWVEKAKKLKVPVRLVHFSAPKKLCEHNDAVRALAGEPMNPEQRTLLPKIAFSSFVSRYQEPKLEEGFEDITRVDFKFHGSDQQKQIWRRFWIS